MTERINEESESVDSVAGGVEYRNVCSDCNREWYSPEIVENSECMPDWYTGPFCPVCMKLSEKDLKNAYGPSYENKIFVKEIC